MRAPDLYVSGWESPHDHMLRCQGCYDPEVDEFAPEYRIDMLPVNCESCGRSMVTPRCLDEMVAYVDAEIHEWEKVRRMYQELIDNNAHTFDWQ